MTSAGPAPGHRPGAGRSAAALAGALLLICVATAAATAGPRPRHSPRNWVGTWAAAPTAAPDTATPVLRDATVRQVVHTSAGGDRVRLRLTNEFGETPLHIGEVRVALHAAPADAAGSAGPEAAAGPAGTGIDPHTDRPVTFGGRTPVRIPAGAPVLSDPVRLDLPPRADLVVSLYLPERAPVTTLHGSARQENGIAAGNATGDTSITATETITEWYFLSGVSVRARSRNTGAVVALGDSITDGSDSTTNANRRWPDLLAQRLGHTGVLNAGIGGNRLLHDPNPPAGSEAEDRAALFGPSALRRFDRDVLAQPGAEHVIVLLGVNDLGQPGRAAPESETVTAEQLINAHRQLIARAHAGGLRIHGGTILPFKGAIGVDTPENEAKRQAVNEWIRTSGAYDGVIDFAAATRDPHDPQRLHPDYDSGDHVHPNDAGMQALADAVPAGLFGPRP
ncbi:SGNH/GDSL hydrolase family protein [Streptomonospora sediminis]